MTAPEVPAIAEIVREDWAWIELRCSARVAEFFNKNCIHFNHADMIANEHLTVMIGKNGPIEQYSARSGHIAGPMGAFSYIYTPLEYPGISIGRYCSIGSGMIVFGERHPLEWVTTSNISYAPKPVFLRAHAELMEGRWPALTPPTTGDFPKIGHDVWIGQNVSIARNVTIGTGAILGACAVVTKDVAPYSIVVGNPGRIVRQRFPDALATRLLESRWWDFHPDHLFEMGMAQPAQFLDKLEAAVAEGSTRPIPIRGFEWHEIVAAIASMPPARP